MSSIIVRGPWMVRRMLMITYGFRKTFGWFLKFGTGQIMIQEPRNLCWKRVAEMVVARGRRRLRNSNSARDADWFVLHSSSWLLLKFSKAFYCNSTCQKEDWKKHKPGERIFRLLASIFWQLSSACRERQNMKAASRAMFLNKPIPKDGPLVFSSDFSQLGITIDQGKTRRSWFGVRAKHLSDVPFHRIYL